MFKKIISTMLALVVVIGGAIGASAVCASEESRPGIIGLEYLDAIIELDELYQNDEFELQYRIEMDHVEDYWMVSLEGESVEGYTAIGFYDHYPTEEELDILWANRLTEDELDILIEELNSQEEES